MDNMGLAHHAGRPAIQIWLHTAACAANTPKCSSKPKASSAKTPSIRHDNAMLRAQVDDLQNGYEALSELARSELGYIEEGETYYNLKRE